MDDNDNVWGLMKGADSSGGNWQEENSQGLRDAKNHIVGLQGSGNTPLFMQQVRDAITKKSAGYTAGYLFVLADKLRR